MPGCCANRFRLLCGFSLATVQVTPGGHARQASGFIMLKQISQSDDQFFKFSLFIHNFCQPCGFGPGMNLFVWIEFLSVDIVDHTMSTGGDWCCSVKQKQTYLCIT